MAMMNKKANAMRRLAGRAWDSAKNKDQFMAMLRSGSVKKMPLKGGSKVKDAVSKAYQSASYKRKMK